MLDLSRNNWPQWSQRVQVIFGMSPGGLLAYIEGRIPCPDAALWPTECNTWLNNDAMARSFCGSRAKGDDLRLIMSATSAYGMWCVLKKRHERQGPYAQAVLLRDLLSVRFDASLPLPNQGRAIVDRCERIVAMGPLSTNSLAVVALLHSLGYGFEHIATAFVHEQSDGNNALTSARIIQRLESEQQIINGRMSDALPTGPSSALAASSRPLCTNCKVTGHWLDRCYQVGGPLYPQRDQIIAEQKRRKAERKTGRGPTSSSSSSSSSASASSSSSSSARHRILQGADGKAYFVDGDCVVALSGDSAPPRPPSDLAGVAFAGDCAFAGVSLATDTVLAGDAPPAWILALGEDSGHVVFTASSGSAFLSADLGPFILDSGASIHLSPVLSDFSDFRTIPPHGIRGVNGSMIYATGVGSVSLRLSAGYELRLDNVLYVPEATVRLISIRALCDGPLRFSVSFSRDSVTLRSASGDILFSGARQGQSLFTLAAPPPPSALVATRLPNLETIHRRYGHPSYAVAWRIAMRLRAAGTPLDLSQPPIKCDSCILGKQKRTPVPKSRSGARATAAGELIYIDGAGEQATRSATGNLHSLDLLNDFSSLAWTFPVPKKSSMASVFRRFVIAMRALGHPVKRVQIDNGELVSAEVDTVCAEFGISVRRTAPYTSAHNGRVERLHGTFMSRSRTMRIAAGVPENRWDEFYVTACYLYNRSPTTTLPDNMSPFEVFYGRSPDNSHLREIGCRAFVLINTHNPKIRARSIECVLIGYGSDSKTYRCYHRATSRVLASYHVRFIESHEDAPRSTAPPAASGSLPPLSVLDDVPPAAPAQSISALPAAPPACSANVPSFAPPEDSHAVASEPAPGSPLRAPVVPAATTSPPSLPTVPPAGAPSQPSCTINAPGPPPMSALTSPPSLPTTPSPPPSPRRSSRLRDAAGAPAGPSRLERAIAESAASAERVQAERAARRDPFWTSAVDETYAAVLQLDSDYSGDPATLAEALAGPFAGQWKAALDEELAGIQSMGVYVLVPRSAVPAGRKIMRGKPVFRLKRNEAGEPMRFKARWVVRGYEAVFGLDYDKTTSPTMRMESFRLLCHIAAANGWHLGQLDVKTAFLYGLLPEGETCYMEQPSGFEVVGKESWVWELRRGLYGMPQGGRTWNKTMNSHLEAVGFAHVPSEVCLYARHSREGTVFTGVHVDDFLYASSSDAARDQFVTLLGDKWTITNLGEARFCIGIALERNLAACTISLSQTALIDKILVTFRLSECSPVSTPMDPGLKLQRPSSSADHDAAAHLPYRALVGSLNYLAVGTRPDIAYAVQQLAQFLDCYASVHWEAAKRVARYLKGTRDLKLTLGGAHTARLLGFTDSDWARCPETRRSIGGYCFNLGSGAISWAARKQKTVSDSSTEAEYIAAADAAKECVWLRSVLAAFSLLTPGATPLYADNRGAIILSDDSSFHARTKHIDIKHHILRDFTSKQLLSLHFIPSTNNVADIFTKPLAFPLFSKFRSWLGLQ